jgi:hypothetical protein
MFFGIDWFSAFMRINFQIVFAIVTAIPFYFAWNCIAPIYLYFIPSVYKVIPYWHIVAIILCSSYLGEIIARLTPKIVNVSQHNENNK